MKPSEFPRQLLLVVDDDPATREVLCAIMEMNGMFTAAAATVAEGLKLLSLQPAFLVLDLHLPDGLGTTILQHVRQRALPISVAIATATGDSEFLARVAAMRPDRILRKPYVLEDLLEWIHAAKAA
jgi:two-component system KDP operon response regulator KdpE